MHRLPPRTPSERRRGRRAGLPLPAATAIARIAAAALIVLSLAACDGDRRRAPSEIMVFAAASVTDALIEIADHYEDHGTQTGGSAIAVRCAFGSSSDLARQIRAGAPADVFFSADVAQMNGLIDAGLVRPEAAKPLLTNQLVVVVPAGSTAAPGSPADLSGLGRIAIADPEAAPAGVYARQWLESLGLWTAIAPLTVPTVNVRAALAAVETGSVDAAIVYRTDLMIARRARLAFEVPREHGPDITFTVARLSGSSNARAADLFVDFLASGAARDVFERHGFSALFQEDAKK